MNDYLPLVKVLNGIEKEDLKTILEVDKQGLINHQSKIMGVTGPQGAGKSTLLSDLVGKLLAEGHLIGVLLVDPTDPYTKGAFLGDRIRFNTLPIHKNLFIRSVASRGFLGGVSLYTPLYLKAFITYGFPIIFVETVGSGQSEVDIYKIADVTLYITSPDIGDSMQVMKGGSMNNYDILVINKDDLPGADRTETLIKRNSNLSEIKREIRLIKHRKGRDTSLQEIQDNIFDFLSKSDITERRKGFIRYYQEKFFLNLIEKDLGKILEGDLGSGENLIQRAMLTYQDIMGGR